MTALKGLIRSLLIFFHCDLTKNLEYDRLTRLIMKKVIGRNTNCVDVGCHKGEILSDILHFAPEGAHFAFEPIPYLYHDLKKRFEGKAKLFSCALSDTEGETTFQLVKNAPAYSGLQRRKYAIENPDIEEITVPLKRLDAIIPSETRIGFIKIDVEGGEYGVLKGARELLLRHRPVVVFECGLGASDYYGTNPSELYRFLRETGLRISTLKSFSSRKGDLSEEDFIDLYQSNKEYYFIAHPSLTT